MCFLAWVENTIMDTECTSVDQSKDISESFVSQPHSNEDFFKEMVKVIVKEEMKGNTSNTRQHFERWLEMAPDHRAWKAYIRFELQHMEIDRARSIFERYVTCHCTVKAWISYAKFEVENGCVAKARECYERATVELDENDMTMAFYIAFGEFEECCQELERALEIYKYALDHLPGTFTKDLQQRICKIKEALAKKCK